MADAARGFHAIWNPWHGCTKVSEGCRNCYMYALDSARGRPEWSGHVWETLGKPLPLQKHRDGSYKVRPGMRLQVNMTSDTFHPDAAQFLERFWDVIRRRPDVRFWLLTKRPERIRQSLPPDWGAGWGNVMLSVTAEDQQNLDARLPALLDVPARLKGICCAPLLGPIDLSATLSSGQVCQVMAGGENYDCPRPCGMQWVKDMSAQCLLYNTEFVFYETGTHPVINGMAYTIEDKRTQSIQAWYSGFSHGGAPVPWELHDTADGHLLTEEELYVPQYRPSRCAACANRACCNGCTICGSCKGKESLVGIGTLRVQEAEERRKMEYAEKTTQRR